MEIKNILLAEDDEVSAYLIIRMLKNESVEVIRVKNGQDALGIYQDYKIDLILMDLQMPIMDGLNATKEIRKLEKLSGKHIPIIAVTAYALVGDKEKCLEAGMDYYISKPMDVYELMDKIKRYIKL